MNMLLFAPLASRVFGERVAEILDIPLAVMEEREFKDGEHKARPLQSVRGADVYVIHALYSDETASVNDKLCRLLFFLAALRDASAGRITAVLPYLCYARKDRKTKFRDPVTTRYVATLFEAMQVNCVAALDVHNLIAFQNAYRCRTEHLEARMLFVNHFARLLNNEDVLVLSPDEGGLKRAEAFRRALSKSMQRPVPVGFMEKRRSGGVVSGERLYAEVNGRTVIMIDDLISTGGTLLRAARAAKEQGARAVHAAATHGLFTDGAQRLFDDPALDSLVITDSVMPIFQPDAISQDKVSRLSIAPLVAEAIRRMHNNESLTELSGPES